MLRLFFLYLLIPCVGYCQHLDFAQCSNHLNKINATGQRTGLWVERFGNDVIALRGYNKNGRIDGVWLNFKLSQGNKSTLIALGHAEDGLKTQVFSFHEDGKLAYVIDSVQPINTNKFHSIRDIAERSKNSVVGQYGIVQYYCKQYNKDDGSLKEEGWYCNYLDNNNHFDYEIEPLPIGIHKYYNEGKVIFKDNTNSSIQILLNMIEHEDDL